MSPLRESHPHLRWVSYAKPARRIKTVRFSPRMIAWTLCLAGSGYVYYDFRRDFRVFFLLFCSCKVIKLRKRSKPMKKITGANDMLDNLPRGTICIEDMEMGMSRYLQKVVTDRDIELFAEVSTDRNPVHLDDDYAQDTIFQGRIAHGMLTAGLISAVIGEQLPGHGAVYMSQNLKFLAPVRPGDLVHAQVTVIDIEVSKRRVKLDCECTIDGKKVLVGEATVLAPSRKFD